MRQPVLPQVLPRTEGKDAECPRSQEVSRVPCRHAALGPVSSPDFSPQSALCEGGLSLMSFPQGYKLTTHHFFPFIDQHY